MLLNKKCYLDSQTILMKTMPMKHVLSPAMFRKLLAIAAFALPAPVFAQQTFTYDFTWYSGASQTWVYEAGPKLLVDVYDDPATPENDVFFRFRNSIDTPLGYSSSIVELEIDTGTAAPNMLADVSIWDHSAGVRHTMYTPCNPTTLLCGSTRIAWSGDYASGGLANSGPKSDGVNPGEYLTLRAVLSDGIGFTDVVNALGVGLSATYVEGHYGQWTTTQKQTYRDGAAQGLRFALLVQSIVPNDWNPEGHGLFVTHNLVATSDGASPQIASLSATPSLLLDTETSQLSVVASDPDGGPQPLFYQWAIVSGGGVLDDPASSTPVYTPDNVVGSQTVTLRVDVSDGENTVTRTVALQVNDADAPPPNVTPQISELSATPTTLLDTATSQLSVVATDPDGGPQPLSYQWSVINGGGVLDDATSATPVYTPADGVGTQTATLRATVSDGEATVSQDLVLTIEDANPPLPGSELLFDDFSSGTLTGWTVRDEGTISAPSKWRIVSGELMQQTNIRDGGTTSALPHLGTYLSYDEGLGWTDYRARFKLRSTDDDTLGVMFRFQDNDNYYRFSWDKQLNQRRLVKKAGGVFSLLAADNVPYVMGQNHQLEIVVQGSQLEVWIDGARIFQITDASLNRGSVAFYTWMNNAAYFDDVQVNAIE